MSEVGRIKTKENEGSDCWGYAVCFGTAITFIAGIGHVNSFGLIYNDFIIDTQSTAKSLTTAHGKRTTVMSVIKAFQGLILIWYPQLLKLIIFHYGFRGTLLIISGISLHTIPGMLIMKNKPMTRKKTAMKLMEILNLKAFKDPVYRNICIGQSFVNFSDLNFFILQPMLLFQFGYDTSEVATFISICAGADVAGRCALAFVSSITHINTRVLFFTATLITFVFRIALLQLMHNFVWVATVTGVLGLLRAWLHVASPLVISNHVSHEDFPGAYALFMLSGGLVNVSLSPVIGLLKDIYQDYVPAFYALTVCCLPCLLTWPIEYFYRNKTI
ncbi:Uncharacterized protein OBRU01_12813 [Operophtera brumata]|uniref:Monocarboxylate transporter n=1 Tax=Operophtera brumata TaxID=104452 RepID=A0A0L7L946_OPEBR|nr:Uncharacterized protein OBRU01_12813 [Operophtera brumata]